MKAALKSFDSPDVADLKNYRPAGPFGFTLFAEFGPDDGPGKEIFTLTVCTPEWFQVNRLSDENIYSGRHTVFMRNYSFDELKKYLQSLAESCTADTWREIGTKLGRFAHWEFEDYNPNPVL